MLIHHLTFRCTDAWRSCVSSFVSLITQQSLMLSRVAATTLRRGGSTCTVLRAAPSVLSGSGLAAFTERACLPALHATLINGAVFRPRHDLTRGFAAPAKVLINKATLCVPEIHSETYPSG